VGDATSASENHAIGGVVGLDVRRQVVAGNAHDILAGTEDGATERLALESGGMQVVKNDFFNLLVDFLLFTENDIAFAFNGRRIEF